MLKPGAVQSDSAKMGVIRPPPIGPRHEVNPTSFLVYGHDTVYRKSPFREPSDELAIEVIKIEMVPSVPT